ncbi:MAG: PAS domain-containing protein [Firmicutes bacterium]|nr:PAS domain-containing protein [Bacillota bacterium]
MCEGNNYLHNFSAAITVCDTEGKIVYMNEKSKSAYAADGGAKLVGKNALDCHPEPARSKMAALLKNQGRNCYTVEKGRVKKLLYQAPWYKDSGEYGGLVELALEIPKDLPHYIRQP